MIPKILNKGDKIGIISPSHIASPDRYERIIKGIESRGFQVTTGKNLYKNTYGYLASEEERADDFNDMICDETVKMIFFGGGVGSVEILPLINYENIVKNPKKILSYSDGTSILNAVYSKTGLLTYYGQTPAEFEDLRQYNWEQFSSHFLNGQVHEFVSNSKWYSLNNGIAEGVLVGGFSLNFAHLVNSDFFNFDNNKKYILFLEDNEKFNNIAGVSVFISCIEQSRFINNVAGLIFGHFSEKIYPELMDRLKRFGLKHNVPVAYCDDFGHGKNHAILPIGCNAILNTNENKLMFDYDGV